MVRWRGGGGVVGVEEVVGVLAAGVAEDEGGGKGEGGVEVGEGVGARGGGADALEGAEEGGWRVVGGEWGVGPQGAA